MAERTGRPAGPDDLDAIAALTRAHRHRLAEWSAQWWSVAPNADDIHHRWLGYLIGNPAIPVRVVEERGRVVGCAVAMPQPHQWFVDDVAIADEQRWPDLGPDLFGAITERPALTCVASRDLPRIDAARAFGLELVSGYWLRRTEPGVGDAGALGEAEPGGPPPRHTFGPPFDPMAAGALAHARGDVLLSVVCAEADDELRRALGSAGFERTVEVFAWPDEAPEPTTR